MNVKISIIMPTYNVEKYFSQAIESAINQSIQEIEIITIDDESPDNCGKIMDEYAKRDSRIKPIHKKNGGYGSAVNAGINKAVGEYIVILEPDDYIEKDLYQILYMEAKEFNLDICRYNCYSEIRNNMSPELMQTYYPGKHEYLSKNQLCEMFAIGHPGITLAIYRREYLVSNGIKLDESNKAFHDVDFVLCSYLMAKRIKIIQTCGYNYRRDVPTQSVTDMSRYYCIIQAINNIFISIRDHNISLDKEMKAAVIGYSITHLRHYYLLTKDNSKIADFILETIKRIIYKESHIYCKREVFDFISSLNKKIIGNAVDAPKIYKLNELDSIQSLIISGASYTNILSLFNFKLALFYTNNNKEKIMHEITLMLNGSIDYYKKNVLDVIKKILSTSDRSTIMKMHPSLIATMFIYLYKNEYSDAFHTMSSLGNKQRANENYNYISEYSDIALELYRTNTNLPESMKRSAYVEKNMKLSEKSFLKYIQGKSIAVVGNSPCHIGLGKGEEIDTHDIVIRFNNYTLSPQTENDYGSKVDVWGITPNIESINNLQQVYKYDYVISCDGAKKIPIKRRDFYYKYLMTGGSYFRIKADELINSTNIRIISMGLYVVNYLVENSENIEKINLYGFSLIDHYEGKRHY
ncbi:glycosyltransferase family 29 protein, partial [Oceanispirochaeta sp. M1]|uniref:glycosyltransferase family 29 protein n=2 Tax=unclassified Oceanispirochaeta TaxID=2635722 RepID=UPI000E0973E8